MEPSENLSLYFDHVESAIDRASVDELVALWRESFFLDSAVRDEEGELIERKGVGSEARDLVISQLPYLYKFHKIDFIEGDSFRDFVEKYDYVMYRKKVRGMKKNEAEEYLIKTGDLSGFKFHYWEQELYPSLSLEIAAKYHQTRIIDYILSGTRDSERSLLIGAIKGGHYDLVKKYDSGTKEDAVIISHEAAAVGNLKLLKEYVERFDLKVKDFRNACDAAVLGGHVEVFKYLQSIGFAFNGSYFYYAAKSGSLEMLKYILEIKSTRYTEWIYNGFADAAEKGHFEMVEYLFSNFKDEIEDIFRTKALLSSAKGGHLAVVKFLVKNIDYDFNDLQSALRISGDGNLETVKYLLETVGRDESSVKKIIESAAKMGNLEIIKYFEDELEDPKGDLLILAAEKGRENVVLFLLDSGIEYKDEILKRLLEKFTYLRSSEVVEILLDMNLGFSTKTLEYILPSLASYGRLHLVKRVIEMGIDNKEILTNSLLQASRSGQLDVVQHLLNFVFDEKTLLNAIFSHNPKLVDYLLETETYEEKTLEKCFSESLLEKNHKMIESLLRNVDYPDFMLKDALKTSIYKKDELTESVLLDNVEYDEEFLDELYG